MISGEKMISGDTSGSVCVGKEAESCREKVEENTKLKEAVEEVLE